MCRHGAIVLRGKGKRTAVGRVCTEGNMWDLLPEESIARS